MSAPSRRPIAPKLGNSFLTRQLSLQSPTPPIPQSTLQPSQQLSHQHRKLAFRRQSSEDLSLRRGRRRGRDTPSPTPSSASDRGKSRNPPSTPSEEKRANTAASDRSSDVRWRQDAVPAAFNRHFPPSKEPPLSSCPTAAFPPGAAAGPIAGRPITPARPRPVRLAWAEKRSATVVQAAPITTDTPRAPDDPADDDAPVEVVAKKMGQPKPVTGSILKAQLVRNQHSLPPMAPEKDSVLQTRQQLADKLRRAWWGEDQLRPNLDIFLTCLANESNGGECSPPGDETTKERVAKCSEKEKVNDNLEASAEHRESKMISIKIDTVASENSSREGDNEDLVPNGNPQQDSVGESPSKGGNGRPRPTTQSPQQSSPPSSKSTSSTYPSSSRGQASAPTSSSEPKASSNTSPGHAAGNEFVCGVEVSEKIKGMSPYGQGCADGSSGSAETATPREPVTPTVTFSPTSSPSAIGDASPTGGQVTNGFSGKGASENKREATSAKAQATSGQGNESKASGLGSASFRRAQFKNSGMNRRTLGRSVDSIPSCTGQGGGPAGSGAVSPGLATTVSSSRTNTSVLVSAPNGSATEATSRAKEEAMKTRRGIQQVHETTAERNPWKRNAESAGITRSSTVDGGEGPQPVEFGPPSSPSAAATPLTTAASSQPRPSTAAGVRPAVDRPALRSAPSFVTAAAAKHRQKTSSKRRSVRRSTEDDEGAEGEGAEDVGGGVRGPGGGYPKGKGGVRGAHADVVTMVSLVSPTGSDTDEPPPQVFSFPRDPAAPASAVPTPVAVSSRAQSARRSGGLTRMLSMDLEPERSTAQRKLHKSVSFQSDLLLDDEEEDIFSRRPAFPASLIIPRIPTPASTGGGSLASPNPVPPPVPSTSSPAPGAATSTATSKAPSAPPPVIIPPSLSQHVPKIVDPGTPRSTYSPPLPPSKGQEQGRFERPSTTGSATAAAGTARGLAMDRSGEEDGSAVDECTSPGEKERPSRKRVMFRSRSASLRGSEEDHSDLKERTGSKGGAQSSHASGVSHGGSSGGGAAACDRSPATSASDAAVGKYRGLVVTLTERQGGISSVEDRARGEGGGLPRPSTAGGSRSSNSGEKGKRDEDMGDGKGEDSGEAKIQKPDFKSAKEKECWELYRRMCDKGLTVSYDTILRGMLTPTEYRMRRNALLSTC